MWVPRVFKRDFLEDMNNVHFSFFISMSDKNKVNLALPSDFKRTLPRIGKYFSVVQGVSDPVYDSILKYFGDHWSYKEI